MSSRINARVDDELAHQLDELRRLTGTSTSALIKAALEAYLERARAEREASPRSALERAGFIGCATGERTLSTRYKRELSGSLGKKT